VENSVEFEKIGIFSDKTREIQEIAIKFHEDRHLPVLIEGETGTGKEIVAHMIHYGKNGDIHTPFIPINCTAISQGLFESELFGYEEGAFTGAKRKGAFGKLELAQKGTLFLDEIGDLPLDVQPKLLRVLEEREFFRVGGLKKIKLDIRVICASNRVLEKRVDEGAFRQDLYYRLNVGHIRIPPLRERREEIIPLARMFLEAVARQKGKPVRHLNPEAALILKNYDWPGNIRELQNVIERIVLLNSSPYVLPQHLDCLVPRAGQRRSPENCVLQPGHIFLPPDKLDLARLEAEIVQKALKKFNNNKTRTAAYLGITRSALRSKLK